MPPPGSCLSQALDTQLLWKQQRVNDLVTHYKGTIHYWDVVNEANYAANVTPANGETNWVKRDGAASVVETALAWARSAGQGSQAAYVTQFYTILFSHPAVRAITWWDLSDRNAFLGAPSGLLHNDMTPKPAYTALQNLIHHTWWSSVRAQTNQRGTTRQRVFYGDYSITATDNRGHTVQKSVSFPEGSGRLSVEIRIAHQ